MKKSLYIFIMVAVFCFTGNPCFRGTDLSAQAQKEKTQLRYEAAVTLKLVQVYVTDKKGNPVLDLEKDDFIIYDNGKKQGVTEFERHILALPSAKTEPQPEMVKETPVPASRELMSRKIFLFFDFAYSSPKGIVKAKEAALHFIDTQLQPTDEVGLLSYSTIKSLKLHEYLTTDHRKVREIVEGFGRGDVTGRVESLEEKYWQQVTGENPQDATQSGKVFDEHASFPSMLELPEEFKASPGFQKFMLSEDTRIQALFIAQKMGDLAKALRYVPGHKIVLFFSSGVPYSLIYGIISPFGQTESERDFPFKLVSGGLQSSTDSAIRGKFESWGETLMREKYEAMLKEFAASNCSLFTLDTMDLGSGVRTDTRMLGVFSLQKMASATGGKYFGNINNYAEHIDKIQNLTGCYYVVGYPIDEKWDGAYHQIKVEVDRPGCRVHAQKGYFNPKPFTEYNNLEKMLHLVDLALSEKPLFQTPASVPSAALSPLPVEDANLCLISRIQKEGLREVLKGKFEIISVIFDAAENIVELRRGVKTLSDLPQDACFYYSLFSLAPGSYKCRLVIRNLETGLGAVASSSVAIPEKGQGRIRVFPPLLLAPEKDAAYMRGFVPKALLEKSTTFSLAEAFHFDAASYSPYLEGSLEANSLMSAIVCCSIGDILAPEVILSACLTEKSSGQTTPLTLFILSEEQERDMERRLVRMFIPELPAGEYNLNLNAEEWTSKSTAQVTSTIFLR
jgi:VWFA-related protein